jgi:hypothetical protein
MSARLDEALNAARGGSVAWEPERASRVLAGAVQKRDSRARTHRAIRRGLVAFAGASFLFLAFLKTAGGARTPENEAQPEPVAVRALDDGGTFARD